MSSKHLKGVLLILILCPNCLTSPLQKYVIDTRKSAFVNSVLEKFPSCQLTLLANMHSNIQFFSQNSKPMQIFVFPYEYEVGKYSKMFSTVRANTTHPVFYGKKYVVKFNTPVCKLNVLLYASESNKSAGLLFFLARLLGLKGTIADNNYPSLSMVKNTHTASRSVFSTQNTFYLLMDRQKNFSDTVEKLLQKICEINNYWHIRFWTISLIPPDQEFLRPQIKSQLWITSMIGKEKSQIGHSDTFLDQLSCETQDEFVCHTL